MFARALSRLFVQTYIFIWCQISHISIEIRLYCDFMQTFRIASISSVLRVSWTLRPYFSTFPFLSSVYFSYFSSTFCRFWCARVSWTWIYSNELFVRFLLYCHFLPSDSFCATGFKHSNLFFFRYLCLDEPGSHDIWNYFCEAL